MGLRAVSPIPDVSSSRRAFARSSFVYRETKPRCPCSPDNTTSNTEIGNVRSKLLIWGIYPISLAGVGYRPEDRLHECRFPASVGAYYSQEIILCDREVDIFQRLVPVVRYADVV